MTSNRQVLLERSFPYHYNHSPQILICTGHHEGPLARPVYSRSRVRSPFSSFLSFDQLSFISVSDVGRDCESYWSLFCVLFFLLLNAVNTKYWVNLVNCTQISLFQGSDPFRGVGLFRGDSPFRDGGPVRDIGPLPGGGPFKDLGPFYCAFESLAV